MSYRIGDIVAILVLFTYQGAPVTGLTVTAVVRKPDGSAVTGADVSVTEWGNGWYAISVAATSSTTAGAYAATATTTADPTFLDSAYAYGQTEVDLVSLTAARQFDEAANCIAKLTVGSSSSTTSIVTSAMTPAANATDQFKGSLVTFRNDTATAALRGAKTYVTGSTSGGVLTVSPALGTAPASGDKAVLT